MPQTKVHPDQIGEPDRAGRIEVAVSHRLRPSPRIPGYTPVWVNVNMRREPIRIVTYKPTTTEEQ